MTIAMEKTIQKCENCKHRFDLEQFRYSSNGCEHIKENGFICDIFASEGTMVWMTGNESEFDYGCECFIDKGANK